MSIDSIIDRIVRYEKLENNGVVMLYYSLKN